VKSKGQLKDWAGRLVRKSLPNECDRSSCNGIGLKFLVNNWNFQIELLTGREEQNYKLLLLLYKDIILTLFWPLGGIVVITILALRSFPRVFSQKFHQQLKTTLFGRAGVGSVSE